MDRISGLRYEKEDTSPGGDNGGQRFAKLTALELVRKVWEGSV